MRGIVLEGTGLGHAPINVTDDFTKHHTRLLDAIRRMSDKVIIAMASQCAYGVVNMNVYSPGRVLQEAGVLPLPMTSEAAYVKLGWVLGHTRDINKAKEMLVTEQCGEFTKRVDARAFEGFE